MSLPANSISIRKIDSWQEMDACVQLQQSVWQFDDLDIVPRRMFVVARAVGGQIFGAWDKTKLAGYVLAIPGVRDGTPYLHSHMLAVAPEYRNRDIGRQLKLAQRQDALTRGIDRIEWTFDPLHAKNAHFNIEKLGAIVRRYTPDFYGASTSPAHNGLPTDRLHAEWWLQSKRVLALTSGEKLPNYEVKETVTVTDINRSLNLKTVSSAVPGVELLLQVRHNFVTAFSSGLIILRVQIAQCGEFRYLLGTSSESEPV